jgi:hypothetical protein
MDMDKNLRLPPIKIFNLDPQNVVSNPKIAALSNGELILSLYAVLHANISNFPWEITTFLP